jgi:hypothetical protein
MLTFLSAWTANCMAARRKDLEKDIGEQFQQSTLNRRISILFKGFSLTVTNECFFSNTIYSQRYWNQFLQRKIDFVKLNVLLTKYNLNQTSGKN